MIASEISTKLARPGVVRGVLHESRDQAAIFEPLAKAVYRPRTPQAAVEAVAEAARVAMTWPRGAVYVDIPTDVLDMEAEPVAVGEPKRITPDRDQLAAAVAAIDEATNIVVWSGGGVIEADAHDELVALAEKIAAPVVTTFAGRGVIAADHPCAVGLPPHEPEIEALVANADLLVAVGTKFDANSTRNWTMPRPPKLVTINCDPVDLVKNYEPDVGVLADAKLALIALIGDVEARAPIDDSVKRIADATWQRLRKDRAGGPALRTLDAINAARAATDATVVVDMAIPGYWVGGYGLFETPRRLQYPVGWGTLGYALPASVGAGAVRDRPVLTVCGDGGFMFAPGELAVLVQEQLPVTVLLVDDGGYGMLRYDQDRHGDEQRGVDLFRPDFVALAASFGIEATLVDGSDDGLEAVLTEALKSRKPHMVVLRKSLVPPRTTAPRWHEGRKG
jgi:acetolactate synthase-1/2/3 large subunit